MLWIGCSEELLSFYRIMNTDDGVVRNRRRSFVKRVICPGRRGQVVVSSGASSGVWSAERKEWARLRPVILQALEGFPGAREAVVRALVELRALDEGGGG